MDSTPKTVTVTANETVNIVEVGFVNYPEACSLEIYKYETLRDWDDNGFAAVGHIHRIVDIPVTLHLEDGSAQW